MFGIDVPSANQHAEILTCITSEKNKWIVAFSNVNNETNYKDIEREATSALAESSIQVVLVFQDGKQWENLNR